MSLLENIWNSWRRCTLDAFLRIRSRRYGFDRLGRVPHDFRSKNRIREFPHNLARRWRGHALYIRCSNGIFDGGGNKSGVLTALAISSLELSPREQA